MPELENLLKQYEDTYNATARLMVLALEKQSYLLMVWDNGDRVAFACKGNTVPEGFIVYTDEEIRILNGEINPLVHEAKKLGATVIRGLDG
jgi:hypothetical protein